MANINPLYDPSTDNVVIEPEVQARLNAPLADNSGFSSEDQALLNLIMSKIEDKSINLYSPSSLLNTAVYDSLTLEEKGKADQNAMILLGEIREIHDLMQSGGEASFQVKNLVYALREIKMRFEGKSDIFII